MNRKGFTVIELLVVIVILGIVMALVINFGSSILGNAKKDLYVQDAREYIKAARIELIKHSNRYPIDDHNTTTTYYIHINNIPMEAESGSPWGDWVEAYVVVAVDSEMNYIYGWTSKDVAGYTVETVREDKLSRKDIIYTDPESGLSFPAFEGRNNKIIIIGADGTVSEV
ncbi:MAG: prepilin-type N-terminal cleavage/methylation domain-containing protein [Bacilli bacterium]|nr:prepilin-type N-terminal cleavage/methylation domain-containing protein [Bacilli bacterium]